jgi:hypothetical protein
MDAYLPYPLRSLELYQNSKSPSNPSGLESSDGALTRSVKPVKPTTVTHTHAFLCKVTPRLYQVPLGRVFTILMTLISIAALA